MTIRHTVVAIASSALLMSLSTAVHAAVTTTAIRETVEFVTKKFSKEAAQEGTEVLARKIEQLAEKHGDEALAAVRKVGPQAIRAADDAGKYGPEAIRAMSRYGDDGLEWVAKRPQNLELAAKYGDDAVEALVKHKEVAEPLVKELGESAAKALRAVGPQEGRQLAMLAAEPATASLARNPKLLDVIARYGDRGMKFIWDNKKALAVGTVLAAFLADPQPFIDGTRDLAQVVGENLVKPLAELPGTVASQAAKSLDWTLFAIIAVMAASLWAVWRSYLKHRAELRRGASK